MVAAEYFGAIDAPMKRLVILNDSAHIFTLNSGDLRRCVASRAGAAEESAETQIR
jgi:hypothetical protein